MDAGVFLQKFGQLARGPNGIKKLRDMVLHLAVNGQLVEQSPGDESAYDLIERIKFKKESFLAENKVTKQSFKSEKLNNLPELQVLPKAWVYSNLHTLGLINPRNELHEDVAVGFIPMPLISADYGAYPKFETRSWGAVKKGFTHFQNNDIGIAKITPCFENSKSGVFRGLPNGCGAGTTELHIFRDVTGLIVPEYIWIWFKSPDFLSSGKLSMTGSAGQKRIPKEYVALAPFPLPPFEEQKRIVAKVNELMGLCDELEARQQNEEELKIQAVVSTLRHITVQGANMALDSYVSILSKKFNDWFNNVETIRQLRNTILELALQGRLMPQDPHNQPVSELLEVLSKKRSALLSDSYPNMIEAKVQQKKQAKQNLPKSLPILPKGWEWATLMQCSLLVVDCHNKTAPYQKAGIPLLRTTNIKSGRLLLSDLKYVNQATYERWSMRCKPQPGDILITREAPMGEVAQIPDGLTVCMGQRMMLIRLVPNTIDEAFLLYSLQDPNLMQRVQDKPVGLTVKHLRVGGVETLLIPLPPLAEQKRIVAKLDELMALCDQLEKHSCQVSTHSEHLFDALLSQLIVATNKNSTEGA